MRAIILVFIVSATAWAQAPDLPPLEEQRVDAARLASRLERIEQYLNSIESLSASFTQQGPGGQVAQGTLSLERPGKLRFDYGEDMPILIVSDGTTLTFVDYDVGQVTRWPVSDTPLGLLAAEKVDFRSDMVRLEVTAGPLPHLTMVLVGVKGQEDLGYLELTFAEKAQEMSLLGWEAIDAQGYVTRVSLENVQTGTDFASDQWAFRDPRSLPARRRGRGR